MVNTLVLPSVFLVPWKSARIWPIAQSLIYVNVFFGQNHGPYVRVRYVLYM